MKMKLLTLLTGFTLLPSLTHLARDPDEFRTIPEFIVSRGFQYEVHYTTTHDGYVLGLYRIINPIARASLNGSLEPIILQHGLLFSGTAWLFNSPGGDIMPWINGQRPDNITGNNLGFLLANLGYDVWLTNVRGNEYSLNHTHLSPENPLFWDFTFDEMIDYDTPAMIDYVIGATHKATVGWIGHSQGTLMMFGLLATKPYYSAKIKPFISLAPVAYLGNLRGAVGLLRFVPGLLIYGQLYMGKFLLPGPEFDGLTEAVCSAPLTQQFCALILNLINGPDSVQLNKTRQPVYINQLSGSSWKNILHYVQSKISNAIRRYDYGFPGNLMEYGSMIPPRYPYELIDSPYIALLWSRNDYLADPRDVQQLREALTVPLLRDYMVPYETWSHLDFIYGMEAYRYVYSVVVDILQEVLPVAQQQMTSA